jgi:hypothetical protein
MSGVAGLRLIEGDGAEPIAAAAASPTVFARTFAAPPGAPWDQARSVALEARIGAPLPAHEVYIEQRRLEPWRMGRPARFAVCYVRRESIKGEYRAQVEVEGRGLSITFRAAAQRGQLAKRWGLIAGLAVVVGLLLTTAISAALEVRADAEDRLVNLEQTAALRLHQAKAQARLNDQAKLLAGGGARQTIDGMLADLTWIAAAKAPNAHVDALHWERGYIGVEVRGVTPPFLAADRAVIRADHPVRPGVWLWGVGPVGSGTTPRAAASRAASPSNQGGAP